MRALGAPPFACLCTATVTSSERTRAAHITLDGHDLNNEASVQEFHNAQGALNAATGSLINLVREDYPELGATESFRDLQVQLEGTENRINTQRRDYNAAVADYNREVRTFPTNIVAGFTGFDRKVPFEAEAGAENAPDVSFD